MFGEDERYYGTWRAGLRGFPLAGDKADAGWLTYSSGRNDYVSFLQTASGRRRCANAPGFPETFALETREQLLAELFTLSETQLAEALNFVRYLKSRTPSATVAASLPEPAPAEPASLPVADDEALQGQLDAFWQDIVWTSHRHVEHDFVIPVTDTDPADPPPEK